MPKHISALSSNPEQDRAMALDVHSTLSKIPSPSHFKPNLTMSEMYSSYKHSPHSPNSLLLKFAIHRTENSEAYKAASLNQKKIMDESFLFHHQQGEAKSKLGHITTQSLNLGLAQNPKIVSDLLNHQRNLHETIINHAPKSLDTINGKPHLRLSKNMNISIDKRKNDHALTSMADKTQGQFGKYEHHQHVPLKNVWFSYELGHQDADPSGHGHEDEFVVSPHKIISRDNKTFPQIDIVNSDFGAPHTHGIEAAPFMAKNKNLTLNELSEFMQHPKAGIRKIAISHPNADESIIKIGLKDRDRNVSKWANEIANRKGLINKREIAIETLAKFGWPKPIENLLQKAQENNTQNKKYNPLTVCLSINDVYDFIQDSLEADSVSELTGKIKKLQHTVIEIESFLTSHAGKILISAGNDFVFLLPPSEKNDLYELIKRIENKNNLTLTAGIGYNVDQAASALIQAKIKKQKIIDLSGENAKEKIPGGLFSGKNYEQFDSKKLKEGISIEMEHTNDPEIAKEIAADHLTEDPDYYQKIKTIEKSEKQELLNLIHFSRHPDLKEIDPAFQFSGQAGQERKRIKSSREFLHYHDPNFNPINYIHTYSADKNEEAEGMFNNMPRYHIKVPANSIYDLSEDKDNIFEDVKNKNLNLYAPNEHALNHPDLVHAAIKSRGYNGWKVSNHSDPLFSKSVMLYHSVPVKENHEGELSATKLNPEGASLKLNI